MISDAPEWKLRSPQGANKQTPSGVQGQLLPATFAPSPSTSVGTPAGGNGGGVPSPWSPLSVQEDKQKVQAKSRVDTILERARQQIQPTSAKSCDVIETSHLWGLQVWSLQKIQVWLDNYKRRYGPFDKSSRFLNLTRSHSAESILDQRTLSAPYLKFEATSHQFKPVFSEFRRFPRIYFGGRGGQSPFFPPEAGSKCRARRLNRDAKAEKPRVPQSGYCEICECPFSELEEHLDSKVHKTRVGLSDLWTKLDTCIERVNKHSDGVDDEEEHIATTSDQ